MEEEDEYQRMLAIKAYVDGHRPDADHLHRLGLPAGFAGLPKIALTHVFVLFCVCQGITTGWTTSEGPVMKNRLKVLRAERDWSQADLATRLDVSRQSVNAIETGKYDPSLPLAFRIAQLFGMPIEAIFEG